MATRKGSVQRPRRTVLVDVDYEDDAGFWHRVKVPETDRANPERGILVGPPDLASLSLPVDIQRALNNALFNRGLITKQDVRRRPNEVFACLQQALQVNTTRIMNLYIEGERHGTG